MTVIDGATNNTTTVAVGTQPEAVAVNPATNMIYVANYGSANVTVIDGATNGTTTVAVGTQPEAVAVNPVTNKIYIANSFSSTVTVIDGATNNTATVSVGASPRSLAVNAATNRIYVANYNGNTVTVIDGATYNTTTVALPQNASPVSIAVNPVTNKIYVGNSGGNGYLTLIDGATNSTASIYVGQAVSLAVNLVTNKIYAANEVGGAVTVIDGVTYNTTTVSAPLNSLPVSIAVNPVTNKIYVSNVGITNSYVGSVTVIDGATNSSVTVAAGANAGSLSVNPVTNTIYVATPANNYVTVIYEQLVQPIPLTTSITPLPENQTSVSDPTFNFTALSGTVTIPDGVFFQLDTWQNAWSAATGSNPSFTGTLASLQPGFHILYAYATDGQEATSTQAGSPLTGAIQAYGFLVTAIPLVSGESLGALRNNYSGQVGMEFTVGSSPITITALGRFVAPGNSMVHQLTLINPATSQSVSANVNLSNSTAGQFAYAALSSPLVLPAGSTWILVSAETAGGDEWYDYSPVTVPSGVTVNGPIYTTASSQYALVSAPGDSYVPVTFDYLPGTVSPPTVTITSPTSGAVVSGTITITATASAAPGLSIASVQFKLNGSNIGAALSSAPYTTTLNTTTLASGGYTLTAVATDSGGSSVTSVPVQITVTGSSTVTAFLSGLPSAALRNNYSGFVGMEFTTGGAAVTVTQLGRYVAPGNSQTHIVKLVNANGTDLAGGSVTLSLNGAAAGQYLYAALPSPVILAANTAYYLVSQEVSGGDLWYDVSPVTGTSAAAVNGPVYTDSQGVYRLVPLPNPSQSYVPVNFLYSSASAQTAVSISSPAAGVVSGIITLAASATAAQGLSITGVQFQLNGSNIGPLLTSSPYSTGFNTATLASGTYALTAVATDSGGGSATSAPVQIVVGGGSPVIPFLSGSPAGALRNNYSGFVGMKFTTGGSAVTVSQLGRYVVSGNSQLHVVKLVNANGSDVPGGTVTLSLSGVQPGQYFYAPLASPITLAANTSYYIVSQEAIGGDQWYDVGPVTGTNAAVVDGAAYTDLLGVYQLVVLSNPSQCYVPVNFLYSPTSTPPSVSITSPAAGPVSGVITLAASATAAPGLTITGVQFQLNGGNIGPLLVSSPYTTTFNTTTLGSGTYALTAVATDSNGGSTISAPVQITVSGGFSATPFLSGQPSAPLRNNFSGFVGMLFTVGSTPVTVTQLGRYVVAGNNQSHILKLVTDNGSGLDVPGGSVTLSLNGATAGQYAYAPLASAITLAANTSYFLVSQEVISGDQWYDIGPVTATTAGTVNGPAYFTSAGIYVVPLPNPSQSYVPVNFLYGPAGAPPTVSITSPAAGSVSAVITLAASATASSGLSITGVQFQLNGTSIGPLLTSSPYTTTFNTATLVNGAYALTAVATDSSGDSATSAPVQIMVSGGSSATPFLSGQPAAALRNNYSGFVGMKFTTGSAAVTVTQLGRYVVSGNSQSHLLKLVNANGTAVPGGSVTLLLSGATAGQYAYAPLASPITLAANTAYYLVSQEVSGGDQWYDIGPVTGTNAAVISGPVYTDTSGAYILVTEPNPSSSYVPVNFQYTP